MRGVLKSFFCLLSSNSKLWDLAEWYEEIKRKQKSDNAANTIQQESKRHKPCDDELEAPAESSGYPS